APLTADQQRLATRYLPLARALTRREENRSNRSAERDELQAAAYLAVVEAAQSFDPARNVNFATYARHRIRGALRDCQRLWFAAAWSKGRSRSPALRRLGTSSQPYDWAIAKDPAPPIGTELETADTVELCLRRLPRTHALACRS